MKKIIRTTVLLFLLTGAAVPFFLSCKRQDSGKAMPTTVSSIQSGKVIFTNKCGLCHSLKAGGFSEVGGPNLQGIFQRRDKKWLRQYLTNPEELAASDPYLQELRKKYPSAMPRVSLKLKEVDQLMIFLKASNSMRL